MGLSVLNKLVDTRAKAVATGAVGGVAIWEGIAKPGYRYLSLKLQDWFSDDKPAKAEKKNGARKAG